MDQDIHLFHRIQRPCSLFSFLLGEFFLLLQLLLQYPFLHLQEWEDRLQQQHEALQEWNDALNNWQIELEERKALLDFPDETEEDDEQEPALERRIPTGTRPEEDSGLGNSPNLGRIQHTVQANNGQIKQVSRSARISGRD